MLGNGTYSGWVVKTGREREREQSKDVSDKRRDVEERASAPQKGHAAAATLSQQPRGVQQTQAQKEYTEGHTRQLNCQSHKEQTQKKDPNK